MFSICYSLKLQQLHKINKIKNVLRRIKKIENRLATLTNNFSSLRIHNFFISQYCHFNDSYAISKKVFSTQGTVYYDNYLERINKYCIGMVYIILLCMLMRITICQLQRDNIFFKINNYSFKNLTNLVMCNFLSKKARDERGGVSEEG